VQVSGIEPRRGLADAQRVAAPEDDHSPLPEVRHPETDDDPEPQGFRSAACRDDDAPSPRDHSPIPRATRGSTRRKQLQHHADQHASRVARMALATWLHQRARHHGLESHGITPVTTPQVTRTASVTPLIGATPRAGPAPSWARPAP
jgi:hypothetical protein